MCNLTGVLKVEINNKTVYSKDRYENISYENSINFLLNPSVLMSLLGIDISKMNKDEINSFRNDLLVQLNLLSYKYRK